MVIKFYNMDINGSQSVELAMYNNSLEFNISSQLDRVGLSLRGRYTVDLICTIVSLLLVIPIVFGNALVMISIFKFHRLHTPTHVLIASLAIADLVVGVVTIPAFSLVHHARLGLERQYSSCLTSYVLSHCPTGVSLLTLLIIAIERFIAVHKPYLYIRLFRRRTTVLAVVVIWVYIWTWGSITMFTWNHWKQSSEDCNFANVASGKYMMSIAIHMLGVLAITTVLHLAVARTAWQVRKAVIKQAHQVNTRSCLEDDARVAQMLALVLGIFYLCWVPYILTLPFAVKGVGGPEPFWLHVWEQFAGIVVLSNSCFNPIIYAWKNQDFRVAFKKILKFNTTVVRESNANKPTGPASLNDPNVDRQGGTHCPGV